MSALAKAAALHSSGALVDAAAQYRQIIVSNPTHPDALYRLAQICCQQGRFDEGINLARRALSVEPHPGRLHVLLGRALAEIGDFQPALASLDRAIESGLASGDAYGIRGDVLAQLGRRDEAIESYQRAIVVEPHSLPNWCNLGAVQAELGYLDEALASYDRIVSLDATFSEAHINRGIVLARLGRNAEALISLEQGLALQPNHVGAIVSCGDVLRALGRPEEALESYQRALRVAPKLMSALTGCAAAFVTLKRPQDALANLDQALVLAPTDADLLSNRASVLQLLERYTEALESVDRSLQIDPNHIESLLNRGAILHDLGRYVDALIAFDRAVATSPEDVRAHCNRSKELLGLGRYNEALAAATKSLAIDPAHVEAMYTHGMVLSKLRRHEEAIAAFEQALEQSPEHPHALAQFAVSALGICAWDKSSLVVRRLYDAMAAGSAIVAPHVLLQLSAAPDVILAATRRYVGEIPIGPQLAYVAPPLSSGKIRIAYLSGDFRVHPAAYLTAELFERHDRSHFEIIGLSFGPDDHSDLRSRIAKSFDRFYDARGTSDWDVATLIKKAGIDIAVDLSGHTDYSRHAILRSRPASVQVNYLGYAGTMGADFIDYILADETVLPFEEQPYYAEKIVHLPDCFLVNDATRSISTKSWSRVEAGLPDHEFVFCCFNNAYKISAEIFRVWMRLLAAVDGSVLWLSQHNERACDNLRAAARDAGVDPTRIVFAPHQPDMADHLGRHRLADLFLDTPGYNAHTTASDALWAGLPVLTCIGATFPGRVAASLLRSIGLADMVTTSLEEYEALALKLARDGGLFRGIRQRLARNRLTYPLFDTERFRSHIEQAYTTMRDIHRRGDPPQSFSVQPIERAD
jgi:predicted O-linked N-acetylglucosamine transferase (SPINDLY family)